MKKSNVSVKKLVSFAKESVHLPTEIKVFGKLGKYSKAFRVASEEFHLKIKRCPDWVDAWMDSGIASYYDLNLCGQNEEVVCDAIFNSDGLVFVTGMSDRYRKRAPKNVHWVEDWNKDEAFEKIRGRIHQAMERQMDSIKERERAWANRDGFNAQKCGRKSPFSSIVRSLTRPGLHLLGAPSASGVDELIPSLIWSNLSDRKAQVITRDTGCVTRRFIGLISGLCRGNLPGSSHTWLDHTPTAREIRLASRAYAKFLKRDICVSTCDPRTLYVGSILYTLRKDSKFVLVDSPDEYYALWQKSGGGSWAEMLKLLRTDALESNRSIVIVRSLKKSVEERERRVPRPHDIPYFRSIKKHVDNVFLLFDPQYYHRLSVIRPRNNPYRELQIGRFEGPSFKFSDYSAVDLDVKYRRTLEQTPNTP